MGEEVTYYFRIEKEAGLASDEAGNPEECYLSWGCEFRRPAADETEEAARLKAVKEAVAVMFKIAPEHLTQISEQEYRENVEEDGDELCGEDDSICSKIEGRY